MRIQTLFPIAAVLAVAACAIPSPQQRKMLDSMIGRSETDLIRSFGVPSRNFTTDGHTFLAYVQDDSSYFPGSPGFGGFGGFGYGGFGGFGGYGGFGYGGFGGFDGFGGFPPTYYQSICTTTFEIVGSRVASWNLRGDGC